MRKYLKIAYISAFVLFTGTLITSCSEEDYGSDVNEVTPFIFDFAGPETVSYQTTETYSVTPRGGAKYVWEVTGATATVVDGAPNKIDVYFDQTGAVQVSVYEEVANGAQSEISMKTVNVLNLCDWTIEMQDAYGDGWNGASVLVEFVGPVDIAPITLELPDGSSDSQTFSVPSGYEVNITYNEGNWDEEVTYQIYDASGTKIFEDGTNPTIGLAFTTTATCP